MDDGEGGGGEGEAGASEQEGEEDGAGDAAADDGQQVLDAGEAPVLLGHAEEKAGEEQGDGAAADEPEGVEEASGGVGDEAGERGGHGGEGAVEEDVDEDAVDLAGAGGTWLGHRWERIAAPGRNGTSDWFQTEGWVVVGLAFLKHLIFCSVLAGLSALVVRGMIEVGVMDAPDARKMHTRAVPKGGGVGVVVAFVAGMVVLYAFASFSRVADGYFRGVILASVGIAVVAWLDDWRQWPFTVKLAGQVGAGLLAVGSGLYVSAVNVPVLGAVELGWWGPVATLCWILFATNAMNFIDGLNGLAAGVSALAALALAGIAAAYGGWFVYFAGLLLAAGLVGFLPFNFPRARIFLGDVGSQFCGFVLAVLAVAAGRFQGVELSVLLVPMLLFGVLWDVAFTLVRRLMAGERVWQAHRGHLYQIANRAGMPAVAVTLVHWGFVVWGGVCCVAFLRSGGVVRAGIPLLVLPIQAVWTGYVIWRASRVGVGRW